MGHMGCGRRRNAPRVGDSSVGRIVPLGGSDSAGSDSTLSLYDRNPRVDLVDVNHNVCGTHQVCAHAAHAVRHDPTTERIETKSPFLSIDNTTQHRLLRVTMININYCNERECYQKWKLSLTHHRSPTVRQHYYQNRTMDAWEHDYASIEEQMMREMMLLRKERVLRQREQLIKNDNLAIAERELVTYVAGNCATCT